MNDELEKSMNKKKKEDVSIIIGKNY